MSFLKGPILGFQFIFFSQLVKEHGSSGEISSNPIIVIILITILILLTIILIQIKNLHHLVEDVVAALHLLLESDPSFFKQVRLDVAPEKYTNGPNSLLTNDKNVNIVDISIIYQQQKTANLTQLIFPWCWSGCGWTCPRMRTLIHIFFLFQRSMRFLLICNKSPKK